MPKWVSVKIGMQTLGEKTHRLQLSRLMKLLPILAPAVRLRELLSVLSTRGHRFQEGTSFFTYSRQIQDVSRRIRLPFNLGWKESKKGAGISIIS